MVRTVRCGIARPWHVVIVLDGTSCVVDESWKVVQVLVEALLRDWHGFQCYRYNMLVRLVVGLYYQIVWHNFHSGKWHVSQVCGCIVLSVSDWHIFHNDMWHADMSVRLTVVSDSQSKELGFETWYRLQVEGN